MGGCPPHPAPDYGAVFCVTGEDGTEQVVLVQEVERTKRHAIDETEVFAANRAAGGQQSRGERGEDRADPPRHHPQDPSGKIQRSRTRQQWLDGTLEVWDPRAPESAAEAV